MERLPTSDCRTGKKFTIADFLEAGAERLRLSVVVGGEGLSRQIEEPTANRPGLALTGFFDYFAWKYRRTSIEIVLLHLFGV
jgi:HPr kinase/phosphorylase